MILLRSIDRRLAKLGNSLSVAANTVGRNCWDCYRSVSWACSWRNSSSTKSCAHSTSRSRKDLSILIPRWSRSLGARTYSYGANGTAWVEDVGGRQEAAGLRTALYEENTWITRKFSTRLTIASRRSHSIAQKRSTPSQT